MQITQRFMVTDTKVGYFVNGERVTQGTYNKVKELEDLVKELEQDKIKTLIEQAKGK